MRTLTFNTLHTLIGALFALSLSLTPAQAEEVMYYHSDALGSAVAATDATGAVLWTESYEPYGERRERNDGGSNSQWFTGKAQDDAVGLNYFGARWYNSRLGRFTAIDPVDYVEENPQSFNRYAYANNNPYAFTDPDGKSPVLVVRILFQAGKELVRLGAKQLGKNSGKVNKGSIQHTKHSLNQKITRQVKSKDELDAVRNPLDVGKVKVDSRGRPSQRTVGQKAEIVKNPETGKVVSVNPTSSKKAARLRKNQESNQ